MSNRKCQFSKSGGYGGYKKNNKEREELDYYSTPTEEVINILNHLEIPFCNEDVVLENSCGGGHMVKGIQQYCSQRNTNPKIIATDVKQRVEEISGVEYNAGDEYDFLSDNYPYIENIDYIIMNPPYSTLEPFVMKALGIANKGVLVLARLQALESISRYENIFSKYPPSEVWVYVDRIYCLKNGEVKPPAIQAYCWLYFEPDNDEQTELHWIRRV